MRTLIYSLTFCFLPNNGVFAQTEISIHYGCSFYSAIEDKTVSTFDPSEEADRIVAEIMSLHSLPQNFVLKSSNVKNAVATTLNGQRFILYNTTFLQQFKHDANTHWAAYSLLAHEIGHHLSGHDFAEKDPLKRKSMELEADGFAGGTLCSLGSTLAEAQAGINTFSQDGETTTHPPKSARLEAIAAGWVKKCERNRENGPGPRAGQRHGIGVGFSFYTRAKPSASAGGFEVGDGNVLRAYYLYAKKIGFYGGVGIDQINGKTYGDVSLGVGYRITKANARIEQYPFVGLSNRLWFEFSWLCNAGVWGLKVSGSTNFSIGTDQPSLGIGISAHYILKT